MQFPTDEELSALEKAHGRIGVVSSGALKEWCIVLRKPKRAEYKMFRAHSGNDQKRPEAQENLVKQTCVWPPTSQEFEAMLDEWPGIPEACGAMLMQLAGMSGTEQGKF